MTSCLVVRDIQTTDLQLRTSLQFYKTILNYNFGAVGSAMAHAVPQTVGSMRGLQVGICSHDGDSGITWSVMYEGVEGAVIKGRDSKCVGSKQLPGVSATR